MTQQKVQAFQVEFNGQEMPAAAGTAGQVLTVGSPETLTIWTTPAGGGGGDVTKVGTPVNNQLGVWTGDGTIEGDSSLTFDGTNLVATQFGGITSANLVDKSTAETIAGTWTFSTLLLNGATPFTRYLETGVTNTPEWWLGGDGGNFSLRLNNTGTYPLSIQTNGTNDLVTGITLGYATNVTGALTATSFGGITSANLVDKTATETITGEWTHGAPIVLDSGMYIQDNAVGGRVFMPEGASFKTSAAVQTGAIQIDLPAAAYGDNDMIQFEVSVYDYASNESFKIFISGYLQSAGAWNNESVQIIASNSTRDFSVRFGASSGSRQTVWIGELASVWAYAQVAVTNVQIGYTTADVGIYADDWIIGFQASAFFLVDQTVSTNLPAANTANTATTATNVAATGVTAGSLPTGVNPYFTATATSSNYRLIFRNASDASGNSPLYNDSGASLTYNPSSNVLSLPTIVASGQIQGNSYPAASAPTFAGNQADSDTGMYTESSNVLAFSSAGTRRLQLYTLANFSVPILTTGAETAGAAGRADLTRYHLYLNGKEALDGTDTWLRLNQAGAFTSGVYTPNALLVAGTATFSAEAQFNDGFQLNDSDVAHFGTGEDFDMYFNGTDMYMDLISGADFRLRHITESMIVATANSNVTLYFNGADTFRTASHTATGQTSGAEVNDHGDVFHDVGFNDLKKFNDNVSDTLEAGHAGKVAFKDSGTIRTLTLESSAGSDFPVEAMTTVINGFTSGNYTITEGASTTLYYLDGTTRVDTAGGCTVGPGGVANIWREAATVYYIWGSGITP